MNVLIAGAWSEEAYAFYWLKNDHLKTFYLGNSFEDMGLIFSRCENRIVNPTNEELSQFILDSKIDIILPCADFAYWAAQKERLKDSIKMIVNPYPVCKFTEDYFDFYRECKMKGVLCPKTYHNNNEVDSFPLIAKSRDKMEYKKLFNMRQVYNFTVGRNDLVLQKFIEGTVFEVDFLDEWLQIRLLPKGFPHITQIIDSDTVNKNYFSIVIKSLGIKFGTLRFVSDKNKDYIIDAWPMFKWEALFINPSIIDGLLKGSTPKSVKGKLVKVPHAIVMEV